VSDLDSFSLHSQIDMFLSEARQERMALDSCLERGLAFWRCRTSITSAEIDMLARLMTNPTCAETVAHQLGRDLATTQDFLDALIAVGVVERQGDRYHTTAAASQYLQAFLDRPSA